MQTRKSINKTHLENGVVLIDSSSTYIDPDVKIGRNSVIWPNSYLQGNCEIGENCVIGPNTLIRDSKVQNNCKILMSVIEDSTIEDNVNVGPFSHLRKGSYLSEGVHIGNFGEIKGSHLEPGVKMSHFSYIGNAMVGANTDIGAGTITCNYDGEKKHATEIGEDVFIGSDTMLIAPLKIGAGARTGAGAVVTKNVAEDTLVVGMPARAIKKLERKKK